MSAITDENLKNYIKWLAKERPYLVDDATLARLGKLDRDAQEDAYFKDLQREADRIKRLNEEGLLELAQAKSAKGGGVGMDGAVPIGGGDMGGLPTGGGEGMFGGEEPAAAIGESGPPDVATEGGPPAGMEASIKNNLKSDDNFIIQDNKVLIRQRGNNKKALERVIQDDTAVE